MIHAHFININYKPTFLQTEKNVYARAEVDECAEQEGFDSDAKVTTGLCIGIVFEE